MASAEFLSPVVPVGEVNYGNDPPRVSLDFVIRTSGQEITDKYVHIQSFSGHEGISQPFEYQVEFRANDLLQPNSSSIDLDFSQLVGSSATVRIGQPEDSNTGSYPDPAYVSFFNGMIAEMKFQQSGSYMCTLRPELWKLSLVNNYRHFSQMTVKEVIEEIVQTKWGISCDVEGLGSLATYRTQDWIQMGESDLDFIHSLLELTKGYYYFTCDDTSHTVVFANSPGQTVQYPNLPPAGTTDTSDPLPIFYTYTKQESFDEDDYLLSFDYEQKLVAPGSRNILAEPDTAWESDAVAKLHPYEEGDEQSRVFQHYRVFLYGSNQDQANSLNKEDAWTIESGGYRLSGQCSSPKFKPGHVFETRQSKSDCDRTDVCLMRPDLNEKRFVLLNVQHHATVQGDYSNQFTAGPSLGNAIDINIHGTHMGPILGRVVSQGGETAQYQSHNMLKKGKPNFDPASSAFYYDGGSRYEAKGVYVEFPGLDVAPGPVWIMLAESMTSIPETGVVVMVDRSRDNTKIPEVVSVVEQKGSKVIMPNGTMENTRVGDDYSTGYGDSRSIHYGANSPTNLDTAIAKIDGEYASGQFKSASYSVGGSYSYSTADTGDGGMLSTSESHGNRHSKDYADLTESYSKIGTTKSTSEIGTSESTSTVGTSTSTSTVGTSISTSTIGTTTDTSTIGTSTHISTIGTTTSTSNIGTSTSNSTITTSSNTSNITTSTNNTTIDTSDDTSKINNQTSHTTIGTTESHHKVTGSSTSYSDVSTSTSHNKVGSTTDHSKTGTSKRTSLTGATTDSSIVGASNSNSIVGAHNSNSVTGVSATLNATGAVASISATGAELGVNATGASLSVKVTGASLSVSSAVGIDLVGSRPVTLRIDELDAYIKTLEAKL